MHDYLTNTAAALALISPWWLPWLENFSAIAALLLPILGAAWFVVQIWGRVFKGK